MFFMEAEQTVYVYDLNICISENITTGYGKMKIFKLNQMVKLISQLECEVYRTYRDSESWAKFLSFRETQLFKVINLLEKSASTF